MAKQTIESKNIRRFYVPKVAIIYFSDSKLSIYDDFTKNIVEYADFIQIGSVDHSKEGKKVNPLNKKFYPWLEYRKNEESVMKPSKFFSTVGSSIERELRKVDIALIAYKSNDLTTLEYVDELSSILHRNDVFSFHFVVENFVQAADVRKMYTKLVKTFERRKQVYVPVKEESIVFAYQNSNIKKRSYYTSLYINNLIDLFLAPFLDPKRNPDAFSRTKALFYQSRKNFESRVVTTMGYSDAKVDNVDLALVQALSNPMFAAAFDASNTFIIDVKMPFFLDIHLERVKQILSSVVGEWKQFYINSYVGSFDCNKYCQISIFALDVDETKLITDPEQINTYIKKILNNVQKTKKIFDNETKEIVLAKRINVMEG